MPLRDYALTYLPPWLLDEHGSAWARATGDVKDAAVALLKERVSARLPVRRGETSQAPYAPTGALEAIGRDRMMPRALGEGDEAYANRLADAWVIHRDGGTARGALRALRAAGYPEAMLVIRSQRLYKLDAEGELVVQTLPPGSWCFEPEPQPFWSRYAVLFSHENLPPAWTQVPAEFVVTLTSIEPDSSPAIPPVLAVVDNPPTDLLVRVEILSVTPSDQSDIISFRYRFSPTDTWRTVTNIEVVAGPWPLYDATGDGPFLSLDLVSDGSSGSGDDAHVPGEAYEWAVTSTAQFVSVPGEESREMNLIRALTKEWNNAGAVFQGITVVTSGACWGHPMRTWAQESASGETWGYGLNTVLNYHP